MNLPGRSSDASVNAASQPLLSLGQAQKLLRGRLPGAQLVGEAALQICRVHSDTRTLQPGDLYVALRGDNFDGHHFLPQAFAAGAVAALAEEGLSPEQPGIQVPDALAALQQLAAARRQTALLPVVAVTGSNGKTTVTQMTAAILRAWVGEAALATQGNLNNQIGLPLTLLRLRTEGPLRHRAAVLELGMNHPGEIAQLAALAAPTVAVINNAQREHQEFMANVEAVARENGSVIAALPAKGVVVLPQDDSFADLWREMAGARRVLSFGLTSTGAAAVAADVHATARWVADAERPHWLLQLTSPQTPPGGLPVQLHIGGRHNVLNALAAAAAALAVGAPLAAVVQGLEAFEPVAGRTQTLTLQDAGRAVTLVNDSYNANPDSVIAAIDLLASLPGPRWLLLGDMGEVGAQGPQFHAEVAAFAQQRGIEHLWAVGELCAHVRPAYAAARQFNTVTELLQALGDAPPAASVLIKGSKFMKMGEVVTALQQRWGEHAA